MSRTEFPVSAAFQTIREIERAARENLAEHLWDFAEIGAGTGATRKRSRLGFDSLAFRPRVLRGVGTPDLRTELAGWTLDTPVVPAPVGSIARYHRDGARNVAVAAGAAGTLGFMGGLALPALEEVADAAPGPMAYQVYVAGDRGWLAELVARVAAAGFAAICVTADSVAAAFADALRESGWAPVVGDGHPNLMGAPNSAVSHYMARFTWDDLAWLRSETDLPLMLKGVLTPEDAAMAVETGVDVVYVSNHGGLVLDHGPAVTDVLPEIVTEVDGRAAIIADGGVMRGTDVVKMLALGADAVGVGRLICWAVAAAGSAGAVRALEILNEEILATMAMVGAASVADLVPDLVARVDPLPEGLG